MAESVAAVFEKLNQTFCAQDLIRESVKKARDNADAAVRAAQRALSTLHAAKDLQAQAGTVSQLLKTTGTPLKAIEAALPDEPGAFNRYADIWHPQLQMASMVAVVLEFVMNGTLANVDKVKEFVGADIELPIEDYLMGVCNAVQELARLSLNRVIHSDFEMPGKCYEFSNNVFDGFKELNLRNDFLRKRYDGMKYDVKKMEDIMYDLNIRGLLHGKKRKTIGEDSTTGKKVKVSKADGNMTGETRADEGFKVDNESGSKGEAGGEKKAIVDAEAGKDPKEAQMDTTS